MHSDSDSTTAVVIQVGLMLLLFVVSVARGWRSRR